MIGNMTSSLIFCFLLDFELSRDLILAKYKTGNYILELAIFSPTEAEKKKKIFFQTDFIYNHFEFADLNKSIIF